MTECRPGDLLVAQPQEQESFFYQSVILVLEKNDDGALGLVLNHLADYGISDPDFAWHSVMSPPQHLFIGGPVALDTVICLAVPKVISTDSAQEMALPEGWDWFRFAGEVGAYDLQSGNPPAPDQVSHLRLFSGYCGWEAKQLERELASGCWFVVPSLVSDIFSADPQQLWRRVLRRQRDMKSLYASYPKDLKMN